MVGLLALFAFDELWKVGSHVFYGLEALQHRGQEKFIVIDLNQGKLTLHLFNELRAEISQHIKGYIAIAATLPSKSIDEYACIVENEGMSIGVITDPMNSSSSPCRIAELSFKYLKYSFKIPSQQDMSNYVSLVLRKEPIHAAFILTNTGTLIIYRGINSLRPLIIGGYGFDMVIAASESPAIEILGGMIRKDVKGGEAIIISKHIINSLEDNHVDNAKLCAYELIYLSRHDSVFNGISVYEFRKKLGMKLAETFSKDVDIVVPVPETAIPYAIGFAEALNKKFELGFVSTGHRLRSALKSTLMDKLIAIQLKMHPISSVFRGKRVAVIDDSMVTGATAKTVTQILRNKVGAKEVHFVIASPKIVGCPFNMPLPNSEELLAANLNGDLILKYIEADSITWLSLEALREISNEMNIHLCTKCFFKNT